MVIALIEKMLNCPHFSKYYSIEELKQEKNPAKTIGECRKNKLPETIGFEDCDACLGKKKPKKMVQKTLF